MGQLSEVVDVTAQAPLVNATNSTVGTVIEQRAIFDLPLNGRNFTQLISLTPGVSTIDTSQSGAGPSIQGQRNRDNTYVADGVSISRISFGNVVLSPPVDAIQEFRVQSLNSDADLGGGSGGFINLVTKSGTEKLHGTVYDYLRNNVLDARNTFQPSIPSAQVLSIWAYHQATASGLKKSTALPSPLSQVYVWPPSTKKPRSNASR